MRGWKRWVVVFLGIPKTCSYDSLIKSAGIKTNPQIILSISRAATPILLLLSTLIPLTYLFVFNYFHPIFMFPTVILLIISFLEIFEIFHFSPLILLINTHISWERMQVETELPYAMFFLNQLLSLGVPIEEALAELGKQKNLRKLMNEIKNPKINSDAVKDFAYFIEQSQRNGVTKTMLDDLLILGNTQKRITISRLRSMGNMAIQIFIYLLTVYTGLVFLIIVTAMDATSNGMEFFLLDFINPLLFAVGFFYFFWRRD